MQINDQTTNQTNNLKYLISKARNDCKQVASIISIIKLVLKSVKILNQGSKIWKSPKIWSQSIKFNIYKIDKKK